MSKSLQAGRNVVTVGDAVDDAPTFMRAYGGIALGTGTDVAIESADITLLGLATPLIHTAIRLVTNRLNLFWAFVYHIEALLLAAAGR